MAMTGEKTRLRPDFFDFSGCRHRRCPLSARSGASAAPFWETKSVFVTTNSVFVTTNSVFVTTNSVFVLTKSLFVMKKEFSAPLPVQTTAKAAEKESVKQ